LEDEGFYVNDNIEIPWWNFNKMEKRLIASGDKKYMILFNSKVLKVGLEMISE
jgi:hypothetical protein